MTPFFTCDSGALFNEDCLAWLHRQPDQSLDCVVTSPPYWGLRNYGEGSGGIGQEATPQEYIENLSLVFQEVYRCLSRRGSLWLNLGDNFYGGPPSTQPKDANGVQRDKIVEHSCEKCGAPFQGKPTRRFCSAKCGGSLNRRRTGFERPKCLLGLPWRVATRLVDDGWILRNDIIWHKPNARPSPFKDRLTLTYEHLFHFVKQGTFVGKTYDGAYTYDAQVMQTQASRGGATKNLGDVWSINTRPYKGGHFATFPEELIVRPMKATTPPGGVVYDPFMGSGVTASVASSLGLRWVGTEVSSGYCQMCKDRMKSKPQDLFDLLSG